MKSKGIPQDVEKFWSFVITVNSGRDAITRSEIEFKKEFAINLDEERKEKNNSNDYNAINFVKELREAKNNLAIVWNNEKEKKNDSPLMELAACAGETRDDGMRYQACDQAGSC